MPPTRTVPPTKETPRRGLTLLELMLAMTLTAVILAAIGMAIDLHLRMVDSQRSSVENAQIARAILRQIANDLRSTVQQNSADFSGAESLAGDAMSADGELGALAGELGLGESTLSDSTDDIAGSGSIPAIPGLYGNQYELQLDVSRLPRVDEFQRMISPDAIYTIEDIPSDVKTIAYYIQDGYQTDGLLSSLSLNVGTGNEQEAGLVRRVLDRAVTKYATENANLDSLQEIGEVIAPEVTAIEFEYFDGLEWVFEWDMEEQGGLPMAVRITVAIGDSAIGSSTQSIELNTTTGGQSVAGEVYSLVVSLPTAQPAELDETNGSDGLESMGL